ncbi:MAG: hypothetical protein LBL41_02935 [Bifidobacteriaceae bacterium]|nr:hypothetical protein [Bifidobacteriaceae bacterium]
MTLGAFIATRDKKEKSLSLGYLVSGIVGGITEPVLYGVGFRYKKPFIALSARAAIGGLYLGITGVKTYVLAFGLALLFFKYFRSIKPIEYLVGSRSYS